jgi:hypothetical protein
MPDWVTNLLIAAVSLVGSLALLAVGWGKINERVANLKEQMNERIVSLKEQLDTKASTESVAHMSKSLDDLKDLVGQLLERLPKPRGKR